MKTFKDEDGWEYELIRAKSKVLAGTSVRFQEDEDTYVLKPIKPQTKWEVSISDGKDDTRNYTYINIGLFDSTEDQAQLIKEAVEELMKYITGEIYLHDNQTFAAARTAIKDGE